MKKCCKCIALLSVLLLILGLTGCHGAIERVSFDVPESFDADGSYEITFWAKNDSNPTQIAIYNKAAEDFQKLYPGIRVTIKLYTDYVKIYNDVITNISTGTTPNVCISYPDHIATYMTGEDVVVPLDDLIADKKYGLGGSELRFDGPAIEEMVPEFLQECFLSGSCYALPFVRSTEACYINKDLVEALGYTLPEVLTWDFIWEVSEAAMATKGEDGVFAVNGQKVMIPFIYKSTDNMMITMLAQKGADYTKQNGEILLFGDAAKAQLFEIGSHAATRAFSTFSMSGYPGNFLNAGQCIFAIDSTAGATWMGSEAPLLDIPKDQIVKFETVVMPIPQYDPADPKMISQGPSLCIFNKDDPQEVLASWLFMQFLLTNDVQLSYAGTEGYLPVTRKALQSEAYQNYLALSGSDNQEHYRVKIEASKLLMENTGHTFVTPAFNGSASVRSAAGDLIEGVVLDAMRKKTIDDDYIAALYEKMIAQKNLAQLMNGTENAGGKAELGPLPGGSRALLITLGAAWVLIGAAALAMKKKK